MDTEERSYIADAINPVEADADYLAKVIFAEDAAGGPSAWKGVGNVALNRLKKGRYGKDLRSVLSRMSAAVQTKSPQWQKANSGKLNPFEQLVFNRIKDIARGVLSEGNVDNTKGAVLFENIDKFGFPKTWDKSKVQAVTKIGRHTYFTEK
jgi:hypothetical protein